MDNVMAKQQVTLEVLAEIMKDQGYIIQPLRDGFAVISPSDVMNGKDPSSCWRWVFVNKSKKRHIWNFKAYEEFRQALFDSEKLFYGLYDKVVNNPWFQMCDEQIVLKFINCINSL